MEYQSYPAAQPPPKPSSLRRILIIGGILAACVIFGCGGFIAFGAYISYTENGYYDKGHAAFLAGNCAEANTYFEKISGDDLEAKFKPEQDLCNQFDLAKGQHDSGNYPAALVAYLDTSAMGNQLDTLISTQLDQLFQQAQPQQLTSDPVCTNVTDYDRYASFGALQDNLPELVAECGRYYSDSGSYADAVRLYESFLLTYPNHQLSSQVEELLASASVAQARAEGAGTIDRPQQSGTTGTTSAEVIIQNASPERIRLVLTGPETLIEEIDPCTECVTYSGVGPAECPEAGPVGTYTLSPGSYQVLVESSSDTGTTPFTGTWDLAEGDQYSSCFYIVETVGP